MCKSLTYGDKKYENSNHRCSFHDYIHLENFVLTVSAPEKLFQ